VRRWLWAVVGVASMGLGAWIVLTTSSAADFGWFAYTPLGDGVRSGGEAIILSRTQLIGCAIGVFGLVVLVGGVGYRIGRRRGREAAR
jgi:heme/copper-type cytochrome/quinol oxidase subunit 1